jgi:hypothetical protein
MTQSWQKKSWQKKAPHAPSALSERTLPPPARPDEEEHIGGPVLGSTMDEALANDVIAPVYRKREPSVLEKAGHAAKAVGFGAAVAGGVYLGGRALLRAIF